MLVDEFQDLTPAHLLLVRLLVGARRRGVRGGRRRPDDLRLQRRRSGLVDRLRHPVPGRRRPSARGQLPLPGRHRRGGRPVAAPQPPPGQQDDAGRRRSSRAVGRSTRQTTRWATTAAAVEAGLAAGGAPADVAVLTRVNALLAPVQLALVAAGIPVAGGVGLEFADRTSVRAVLAWLRLATGRRRVHVRRPRRGVAPAVTTVAPEGRRVGRRAGRCRRAATPRGAAQRRARHRAGGELRRRHRADAQARRAAGHRPRALVDVLLDDIGLAGAVQTLDATRHGMNRAAQGDDLAAIRHLAAQHDDAPTFERWLRAGLATPRAARGCRARHGPSCQGTGMAARDRPPRRRRSVPAPAGRRRRGGAAPAARRDHAGPPSRHDRHQSAPEPVHRRADHRTARRARRGAAGAWTRRAGTAPQGRGRGRPSAARSVDGDRRSGPGARRSGQRMGRLRVRRRGRRRRPRLGDEAFPGRLAGRHRRSSARRAAGCRPARSRPSRRGRTTSCGASGKAPARASRRTSCSTTRRSLRSPMRFRRRSPISPA